MFNFHKITDFFLTKKHTLKQVGYLYFGGLATGIGGFITVIILANTMSPNDYGNYKYIFSVVGMLSVLSFVGGFRNTTVQSAAKHLDGIVPYLFKQNILLSLPMLIGGFGVGAYYIFKGVAFLGYPIMVGTICSIISNNGIIAYGYLNGRRLYSQLFVLQVLQTVINVAVIFITVLFTKDLSTIFIINVVSGAVVFSAFLLHIKKHLLRNNDVDKKILFYGKHLNAISVMTTIMMNIDSILIFKVIGSQGLALYALATPFVDKIVSFTTATYYFVLPKFAAQQIHEARAHLIRRSLISFSFGLLIYMIYYFTAPILFSLFFPRYIDSIPLTRLFALNIPITALLIFPDALLDSLVEVKNKYIAKTTISIIRIVFMLCLVFPFGVTGVIYSELFARFCGFIVIMILITRYTKIHSPMIKTL